MQPAVFLDRDGTLIEDRGHLRDPGEVEFFPDTVPALQQLQQRAALFIVTHQPGIARGLITAEEAQRVNRHVTDVLARSNVTIREVYCCPHDRSDGCDCVKPNPYHLHQAARDYDIDLQRSFMLGDHPHDVELARRAGATGLYLLTGHGRKHRHELRDDAIVVSGIAEAITYILQRMDSQTTDGKT